MKNPLTGRDNSARVFVIQDMGFDYRDASRHFGEVRVLLTKNEANVRSTAHTTSLLKKRLWDAGFSDTDYLLAVGAPAMIILAGYLAMQNVSACLNVLQWDRIQKAYYAIELRK